MKSTWKATVPPGARPKSYGALQHPKNELVRYMKRWQSESKRDAALGCTACQIDSIGRSEWYKRELQRP